MQDQQATILIVDDEQANLDLLETVLRKERYDVLSALNGGEAIDLAKESNPDLIILDIMMPDLDGYETCQKIKEDSDTKDIPVIFLSALSKSGDKVKGFEKGAVDFITKPFSRQEVIARTKAHLKQSKTSKEAIKKHSEKLQLFRNAQQSILVQPGDLPEAKFAVCYIPVNEASGDLYDVITVDENTYGYFVADISGHNLAASFNTSAVKAILHQCTNKQITLIEFMKKINSALCSVMTEGTHLTACYAVLNRQKGQLQIVNSGHPPIIYMPKDGRPIAFEIKGDVLGAFEDVYFESIGREVSKGDRFFMYSDGLIECSNQANKDRARGIKMLQDAIYNCRNMPLNEAVESIITSVIPDYKESNDDIVLLGVEV